MLPARLISLYVEHNFLTMEAIGTFEYSETFDFVYGKRAFERGDVDGRSYFEDPFEVVDIPPNIFEDREKLTGGEHD